MSRGPNPQVSFADVEFVKQGIFLAPHLQAISNFLEEHEELIEKVRGDLQRGLKNPATGRNGLSPSQVLRSLILMRVKDWDYRELRERIADGYTLRSFTDFRSQPVPKHDAFNRAFNRLTPETLRAVNEFAVKAAVDLGLEDGKKLRVDGAVVSDRYSSSHGQHLAVGYGAGDHPLSWPPRSGGAARGEGILQSRPCGATPHARNPTHDLPTTAAATN